MCWERWEFTCKSDVTHGTAQSKCWSKLLNLVCPGIYSVSLDLGLKRCWQRWTFGQRWIHSGKLLPFLSMRLLSHCSKILFKPVNIWLVLEMWMYVQVWFTPGRFTSVVYHLWFGCHLCMTLMLTGKLLTLFQWIAMTHIQYLACK